MSFIRPVLASGASHLKWYDLSAAQKTLSVYGLLMVAILLPTYALSWFDLRTLREVGIWDKPMKFMAMPSVIAFTLCCLAAWVALSVMGMAG